SYRTPHHRRTRRSTRRVDVHDKRRVLVTGAGGFIGHHLVKRLKRDECWLRGVGGGYGWFRLHRHVARRDREEQYRDQRADARGEPEQQRLAVSLFVLRVCLRWVQTSEPRRDPSRRRMPIQSTDGRSFLPRSSAATTIATSTSIRGLFAFTSCTVR